MAPDNKKKGPDKSDLTDSPKDQEKMKSERATIDLPDVKDIPGQEFVHVPPLGELADTTISSSDEEGERIWNIDDRDEGEGEGNVSREERQRLEETESTTGIPDDQNLIGAELDETDNEGDPLNEQSTGSKVSGSDLDVPASELDDENEAKGEEDEENNSYSLDDNNDDNNRA
jgi:hypothetical protein